MCLTNHTTSESKCYLCRLFRYQRSRHNTSPPPVALLRKADQLSARSCVNFRDPMSRFLVKLYDATSQKSSNSINNFTFFYWNSFLLWNNRVCRGRQCTNPHYNPPRILPFCPRITHWIYPWPFSTILTNANVTKLCQTQPVLPRNCTLLSARLFKLANHWPRTKHPRRSTVRRTSHTD